MKHRFEKIPRKVSAQIKKMKLNELEKMTDRALAAKTLDEVINDPN